MKPQRSVKIRRNVSEPSQFFSFAATQCLLFMLLFGLWNEFTFTSPP